MIRDPEAIEGLLEQIRHFVKTIAIPNEDRTETEDQVPEVAVNAMQALGTFGWSIPEAYGGAGLTSEELALAFLELTQCSVAYRVVGAQNAGIGSECLVRDGTKAQKERYLPRLASGEWLGCLALSEPGAGSDATALQTRAVQQANGDYVLNGHKHYITLAPIADVFTLFARTDETPRGGKGITAFVLERGTPGLTTSESTPKMGQEGAPIG